MGQDYLETAKRLENQGKIEGAYKYYREAASKFLFLVREETNEANKKHLRDLITKAIDSGIWVKT